MKSKSRAGESESYIIYLLYIIGCLITAYLFFSMADMSQGTTRVIFIITILLLLVNMWFSTRNGDEVSVVRSDVFTTEERASNVVSAIISMTVLVITLGVRGVFDNTFKYTLLTSIIILMSVLVIVWVPAGDNTILRYMRDIKTILFIIGSMFGILSIYNVINSAPLISRTSTIQQTILIDEDDDGKDEIV